MTYRVEFTDAAHEDLIAIGNYIRGHAGDVIAERFILRLIAKAETLRRRPLRYRVRKELPLELRAASFEGYLIFYRVTGDVVSIVHVFHGARNITADLFGD